MLTNPKAFSIAVNELLLQLKNREDKRLNRAYRKFALRMFQDYDIVINYDSQIFNYFKEHHYVND